MVTYKYKVARTAKSKPEGKFHYNLISARHAGNELGHAYYVYRLIKGKTGSYWRLVT